MGVSILRTRTATTAVYSRISPTSNHSDCLDVLAKFKEEASSLLFPALR